MKLERRNIQGIHVVRFSFTLFYAGIKMIENRSPIRTRSKTKQNYLQFAQRPEFRVFLIYVFAKLELYLVKQL